MAASIIEAFATFLVLSYMKLVTVSLDLLIPIPVYSVTGKRVGMYLYTDATAEYFGSDHLPFALLALAVMILLIIAPLVFLIAYPLRCFRRCLAGCKMSRFHALHIFVDAFQGCYKDGTDGTRDCRYFAAAYLVVRIGAVVLSSVNFPDRTTYFLIGAVVFLILALSLVMVKPYKKKFSVYNTVDTVFILLLVVLYLLLLWMESTSTVVFFYFIVAVLPLAYALFLIIKWVGSRGVFRNQLCRRFSRAQEFEDLLPHRMIDPVLYDRLSSDSDNGDDNRTHGERSNLLTENDESDTAS